MTVQSHSTKTETERAILVGVVQGRMTRLEAEEHLDELAMLADTAGAVVVKKILQERPRLDPATVIGKGKIREIAQLSEELHATLVIFDDELSPAQVKNLETELENKIIDRTSLILDIFAKRARTREAQTQVELAQLEYLYPRLTRQWSHLSRQDGGMGTRGGPGETQLETDRRLIRSRIKILKSDLVRIEKQRHVRREGRTQFRQVALIGYTNSGKSSLMNALTHSDVFVEDRLFATLDSTIRTLSLRTFPKILLTDTVGFIRKLPHHLVASFRSTLEETLEADVLVHLVDVSHRFYEDHIQTTHDLLKEMQAEGKPTLLVFNKTDLIEDPQVLKDLSLRYPEAVFISALQGTGFPLLMERIDELLRAGTYEEEVRISGYGRNIDFIHRWADVLSVTYDEDGAVIRYRTSKEGRSRILKFLEQENETAHSDSG